MEQEQIVFNIKKRYNNYKEDQVRMIQSITEKEMTHISIDKIYMKNDNGNEILVTGQDQVMKETNRHFQTIAGSVNRKNLYKADGKTSILLSLILTKIFILTLWTYHLVMNG